MLFKFCFHKFIIFDKYRPLNNNTLGVLNIVNAAENYLKAFFDSSASLKYVRDTHILWVCKAKQENQITFFVRYNLFWESFTRMSIYLLHTVFRKVWICIWSNSLSKCISIVHECHGRTRTVQFPGENLLKNSCKILNIVGEKTDFFDSFLACESKVFWGVYLSVGRKYLPVYRMLLKLVANTSVRNYKRITLKIET